MIDYVSTGVCSVNYMTSVREKKRGAERSRVNGAGAVARVLNRGGRAHIAFLMSNRSPLGRSDGRALEYHSCIPVPHHSHQHLSSDSSASPWQTQANGLVISWTRGTCLEPELASWGNYALLETFLLLLILTRDFSPLLLLKLFFFVALLVSDLD